MSQDAHIHHVNVNVDDLATAVPFYRDVLCLPLDPTPDQGMHSQFFRINERQQIHMNVLQDARGFRAHFCIEVPDFVEVFRRAKAAGAIDVEPWGRVRALPNGKMQMFVRDPHGNLIEVASAPGAVIDPQLFADPLVEPARGVYRLEPGEAVGRHVEVRVDTIGQRP
jgi:lactoylglutathione lyase